MAQLLIDKLAGMQIGTHLELTYEDYSGHFRKITGILTDSDFQSGVEISPETGPRMTLDSAVIRAYQPIRLLSAVIRDLPLQTRIFFSTGDCLHPNLCGTLQRKQKDSLTISTESGQTLTVPVEQINSLLPEEMAAPDCLRPEQSGEAEKAESPVPEESGHLEKTAPEPIRKDADQTDSEQKTHVVLPENPMYDRTPENYLIRTEEDIQAVFSKLPRDERQLLSSCHDSFFHGVKVNDMEKMRDAAQWAVRIFDDKYNDGYDWSDDATQFCADILARAEIFDRGLYLMLWDFAGAAYAAYRQEAYPQAGAYALLALKNCDAAREQDLLILLAKASVQTQDYSALQIYCDDWEILPGSDADHMVREVLKQQEIQPGVQETCSDAVSRLREQCGLCRDMENEIREWNEKWTDHCIQQAQQEKASEQTKEQAYHYGLIDKLFWTAHTGMIDDENGSRVEFAYANVTDQRLRNFLDRCFHTDLNGHCQPVRFEVENGKAVNLTADDTLIDRYRAIAADHSRPDRYARAMVLCDRATRTPMARQVMPEYIRYAACCCENGGDLKWAEKAIAFCQAHPDFRYAEPATNAYTQLNLARCSVCRKEYAQAVEYARNGLKITCNVFRIRLNVLAQALEVMQTAYQQTHKRDLLKYMRSAIREFGSEYRIEMDADAENQRAFEKETDPYLVFVECSREHLEEAEVPFARISPEHSSRNMLQEMMTELRRREAEKNLPKPTPEPPAAAESAEAAEPSAAEKPETAPDPEQNEEEPEAPAERSPAVYEDRDGWEALGLTTAQVIDYAIGIDGPDRIPVMLTYLRAGTRLNPDIGPVYRTAALGANDPAQTNTYTMGELVTVCSETAEAYRGFADWCKAAAFLRSAWFAPEGFQYGVREMGASLEISRRVPEFEQACAILLDFTEQAGSCMDRYAVHYHSTEDSAQKQLRDAAACVQDLYEKYILTPPREGAQCTRLFETKRIALAPDGYLGTLLGGIAEGDLTAMKERKQDFAERFLLGSGGFSDGRISSNAVDGLMEDAWDKAGKYIATKKVNDVVQGNGRRNLQSTFTEILSAVSRWYAASERGGDLSWLTQSGAQAWKEQEPRLREKLGAVDAICSRIASEEENPQDRMGAFLLAAAAREMQARLDGTLQTRQDRFFYVDFLRSDEIPLNETFLPELDATFCALPEFNILARIRRHAEAPRRSFRDQLARIYGKDRAGNNYGTAGQIVWYLRETGSGDAVSLPDHAPDYVQQTRRQTMEHDRIFREEYALAKSRGQILPEDYFSRTLEETADYWREWAEETENYGFFDRLLSQCLNYARENGRNYGRQLLNRLEQMEKPAEPCSWESRIREQIANGNYAAAEDWLRRIGCGEALPECCRPWAATCLDQFWNQVPQICEQVSNAGRSLAFLHRQSQDSRISRRLIDQWTDVGEPASVDRLERLLKLLGWMPASVSRVPQEQNLGFALYEAVLTEGNRHFGHPVAAFGSRLKKMCVACLAGGYDCDSLYQSLRRLDQIPECKLILLDFALSQPDRRTLARLAKMRAGGLRYPCILVDRVLITYLNDHYDENTISRMVMALGMPFAFCRPFQDTFAPENFYGREQELQALGSRKCVSVVTGLHGMGKTALLQKAAYDLSTSDRRHVVLLDLEGANAAQAAEQLEARLRETGLLPDGAEHQMEFSALAEAVLNRLEEEESLWILLDRADGLLTDDAGSEMMDRMNLLIASDPDRLHMALTAQSDPELNTEREICVEKLLPLSSTAAEALLTEPLSYLGFQIADPAIVSQILSACGYQPGMIRKFADALVDAVRDEDYAFYQVRSAPPYLVTDTHLRRVLVNPEFSELLSGQFLEILAQDRARGGMFLALCSLIGWMNSITGTENGYTVEELLAQAGELGQKQLQDLPAEEVTALLEELKELHILCSDSSGTYRLASRSFRDRMGTEDEIMESLMKEDGE